MRTRWTLPRYSAEENQDRIWSTWAPFHQPSGFERDPFSIDKNLRVYAAMGEGKPLFVLACRMPFSVVSADRAVGRGFCRPFRTLKARTRQSEIWNTRAHPKRDASSPKCIPREVQISQSEIDQNTPSRIPPLCSTTGVCWEKTVSTTGADDVIRRLLPTSAVLLPNAEENAVSRRNLPSFADLCRPQISCPEFPPPFP